MNITELTQFDLYFPGHWIDGTDRDWASDNHLALNNIMSLFEEAVAAYSKFDPMTHENYIEKMDQSPYIRCLNSIYAKAFVYALDGINKLLSRLCEYLDPPDSIKTLNEEYKKCFGHLKHIRDSAIHIEDRGRGKTRHEKPLNTNIIIIGSFIDRRFGFTGEDGEHYEIEISDTTLHKAKKIIQDIINSYKWS
jgi:hypothetical protein